MAKEGYGSSNFYAGADYGLSPTYSGDFSTGLFPKYRFSAGQFGIPTDPRSANQLKAVSDKLNTGAKTIEVSGVQAATFEMLPEQHLDEIRRLKKIAGADLTFHGPLVEPTGITKQGWDESHREQAERQMWQAVERAHKMDPDGNLVVTFHSSNGLPDPQTVVMEEVIDPKTGKKENKRFIKEYWVMSNDGQMQSVKFKPDYFEGQDELGNIKEQGEAIKKAIKKQNEDAWFRQLQGASYHAYQGHGIIQKEVLGKTPIEDIGKEDESKGELLKRYGEYLSGKPVLAGVDPATKEALREKFQDITHGELYLRDSYQSLQNLYDLAYESAKRNNNQTDLAKLRAFREEIKPQLANLNDPAHADKLGEVVIEGINVLRSIQAPENLRSLREFGVDKSSETFANVAFNAYKKFGSTAPIISVENPPAGMGLAHAEDLRDIMDNSRKKLTEKLVSKEGLSEDEAKKQAKKLIGITWDVGHINMLRKFGYEEKDIVKQTEMVAPYVKHIHLSDNFGMEHTELPMGMGNVPTKKMFEALQKYGAQVEKLKKIAETGGWFGPQGFGNTTPFAETLKTFGSPIYSMKMTPYWNQNYRVSGGYFSGYGQTLPEQHFSMYGAGFSNLPPELGGQMSGRNRLGGAPVE